MVSLFTFDAGGHKGDLTCRSLHGCCCCCRLSYPARLLYRRIAPPSHGLAASVKCLPDIISWQCAIQVFLIGVVSLKWEEDSWLATGPNRPARLCCQFTMILIPFAIFGWLVALLSDAHQPLSSSSDMLWQLRQRSRRLLLLCTDRLKGGPPLTLLYT